MNKVKLNNSDLGFSSSMGPQLRNLVERQLADDLENYGINNKELKFDWSNSCIEGHMTEYLDGVVENYSGITVFNSQSELIAEGWMEFIHQNNFFLAFWDYVTTWENNKKIAEKINFGVPNHIRDLVPHELKLKKE
jgi:hypothetical protein